MWLLEIFPAYVLSTHTQNTLPPTLHIKIQWGRKCFSLLNKWQNETPETAARSLLWLTSLMPAWFIGFIILKKYTLHREIYLKIMKIMTAENVSYRVGVSRVITRKFSLLCPGLSCVSRHRNTNKNDVKFGWTSRHRRADVLHVGKGTSKHCPIL